MDDDQLATQLQFEWERRRQVALQITAAINISDGEQSPEQPPNVAGTGGGQSNEASLEQPEVAKLEEPAGVERQQTEEPRTEEPKPEASRPIEPETNRVGEEEQTEDQQQQPQPEAQHKQQMEQLPDEPLEPWTRVFWTFWKMNEGANLCVRRTMYCPTGLPCVGQLGQSMKGESVL